MNRKKGSLIPGLLRNQTSRFAPQFPAASPDESSKRQGAKKRWAKIKAQEKKTNRRTR